MDMMGESFFIIFSKTIALTVKELNWTNQKSTNSHPANHLGCRRENFLAINSETLPKIVFAC